MKKRLSCGQLLEGVQNIRLQSCNIGELFSKMLPLWSPKLRQLTLICVSAHPRFSDPPHRPMQISDFRQSYEKLEKVSFSTVWGLTNTYVKVFLMRNPKLKKIEIIICEEIDDNIMQLIATHTPQVEALDIQFPKPINACSAK